MVQQIIRVTSEKNSSGDRMVMPCDHDQHRATRIIRNGFYPGAGLMMDRTNPASPATQEPEVSIFQKFRKSVGLETVSLAITRKKDFSRISNPGVPIFLRIILPSEKQKL